MQQEKGQIEDEKVSKETTGIGWTVCLLFVLMGGMLFTFYYGMQKQHPFGMIEDLEQRERIQQSAVSTEAALSEPVSESTTEENKEQPAVEEIAEEEPHREILLVNKNSPVPEDYEVTLAMLDSGEQVASVMYEDLCSMLSDGKKQEPGAAFLVISGYRTREKQERLLQEEIWKNMWEGMTEEEAGADALLTVAPPGCSEHETGLAVDIVAQSNQNLDESQEETIENQWLQENCYRYGFILRYPRGKEEITGFSYESWHFRYVGAEAAAEIMEQGLALEEYVR